MFKFVLLACLLVLFSNCDTAPPDKTAAELNSTIRNFGLLDHRGDFHRLYYYSDAKAVVLYVQGNACPIVRKSIAKFNDLRDTYAEAGVRFFMVNSNLQDSRPTIASEAVNFNIDVPILIDEDQLVADVLDLQITAEVIVLDTDTWTTIYRGPIDDQLGYGSDRGKASAHYVRDVLDKIISGSEIEPEFVRTKGCAIARLSKQEQDYELAYTKDIAPLLRDNCVRCHQEGGIAPWPMNSYAMVVGWSAMMREVLTTRIMPPWQADPHVGSFSNDLSLDRQEIRKVIAWIDGGRKRGEGPDPLEAFSPDAHQWIHGEPGYVIRLEREEIPATGIIDYRYQELEMDFDRDRYLRAVEVKPGNPNVLHHVLARVQYPDGQSHPVKFRGSEWLDGLLLGWAPGGEPEIFPENSGRKIPAGSKVILQLHYTTSGKVEYDETEIGLYFHQKVPDKEYVIHGPADFEMVVPPYARNHPVEATERFDRPVRIYAMLPHMHYRGKSMKYVAHYPDGTAEEILSVPDYNFNWQRFYYLTEPKYLPAGSTITVSARFDNSVQNEFNPDPSKTIYFGEQTFDEMMIGYMSFTYADGEGDPELSSL